MSNKLAIKILKDVLEDFTQKKSEVTLICLLVGIKACAYHDSYFTAEYICHKIRKYINFYPTMGAYLLMLPRKPGMTFEEEKHAARVEMLNYLINYYEEQEKCNPTLSTKLSNLCNKLKEVWRSKLSFWLT